MISFVNLDYIIMLEQLYDEYYDECNKQGTTPLSQKEWYKDIYSNME